MSEAVLEQSKATASRLETVLRESRVDHAKLKRILEMRWLKRRVNKTVSGKK